MGHQLRLVLLFLVFCLFALINVSQSSPRAAPEDDNVIGFVQPTPKNDNKIKNKDAKLNLTSSVTTTTLPVMSDETYQDLIEASKHSIALAEDPRFNKMLPDRLKAENATKAGTTTKTSSSSSSSASGSKNNKNSDENYEYDDSYEYDYDYDNEETTSPKPKKTKTTKTSSTKTPKMHPIIEESSTKSKSKLSKNVDKKENKIDTDNYEDYEEDEDADDFDEDDDDDDDDDNDDDINNDRDASEANTDDEEVVFSENIPCPRYCVCARNVNSFMVATCSRLDPGTQKFGSDITDLIVTNVGPKYPILLGPKFFHQLGLKNVASIKIANCTIEFLHPDAFHGLGELYAVNLTSVGLALISPETFAQNKKLRMLTISGNDLSIMSNAQYLLKSSSIEELDFSRNNLMELNQNAFAHLSNIVYINLSQNNLQKIPKNVFDAVATIEELDLSHNSLKELPAGIFNHTSLAILHLKYNAFSGDFHFGTTKLQQLDLSFNTINQVHHGMFDQMTGLTNLNLKGNGITKIQPDSFLMLKNLRHIDLSMNELDQISSMLFFKNSDLDVIRLSDNPKLSQLPTDGFISYNGYFTVYYLDLSNCAIGALGHKTFSTMPHLTTLKLAWNNINNLPRDTFLSLTKLIDLDLSNNLIAVMDDLIFMENNELAKLNLAGNPLSKLSVRLFMPLEHLKQLDVSECELTTLLADKQLGAGYKFYETLRSFNASGNLLKKISVDDVKNFKSLRSLDISHNPLKCNSDFQNFISYASLQSHMLPKSMPVLANLEDDAELIEIETQAGWTELAQEICKHNNDNSDVDKLEEQIEEVEKKLDDDQKLISVLDKSKLDKNQLNNMRKILKGSEASSTTEKHNKKDTGLSASAEEDANNGGEEKIEDDSDEYDDDEDADDDDNDNDNKDTADADDDDDDDEDDSDNDDNDNDNKKDKSKITNDFEKYVEKEVKPKLKDHGIKVEEVTLSKETRDKFLLDKLGMNSEEAVEDSDEDDDDDEEDIIIERGHIYYTGYQFLIPVIIVVTCLVIILLAIVKVIAMILRKRGERYRMALLASKNSFVYQKLSEDIVKPMEKEPKHPKVHRYAPINQV